MKTKRIELFAALLLVVAGGSWKVACLLAEADKPPQPLAPSLVSQPAAPVVVSPAVNVTREFASPANLETQQPAELEIEMPTPELTWYDPQSLDDVGGIS